MGDGCVPLSVFFPACSHMQRRTLAKKNNLLILPFISPVIFGLFRSLAIIGNPRAGCPKKPIDAL